MNLQTVSVHIMKYITLLFGFLFSTTLFAQQKQINFFNLSDVQLLDSPFKEAQELDLAYILAMEPDRLLAPFLREAGLPPKAESYTNWENTGLDGHIGGHYISALSSMAASTDNAEIKVRLNYMIDELKRCQDANGNGYIGGVPGGKAIWDEIAAGNIRAGKFNLNGKWVPLYNIHKTYAGLRDAWLNTNNEKAREMLIKMTDWAIKLVSQLSKEQIQEMLDSEHGGLNETFADVAAITGDEKYLRLARQFSHHFILDPLLRKEDMLDGLHANTQIPKVIGYKRIADLEENKDWLEAAAFFWDTVVKNRTICIGGNSVNEHFNPINDFSRMINNIEGSETCNTYNILRLSKMLYETSLDKKYIEYYERALYNHILSTQHPQKGGLVYFTQMRPGHYRVYSQPQTSMWCCVGSGIENHAKYGEMIYAHTDNSLFVNLFIPSRLEWKEKKVEVIQENHFPDETKTLLIINPVKATIFTLQLRYPEWVKEGELTVWVNGKKQKVQKNAQGYISLNRNWKKGDKVEVEMPMHIHVEQLPDHSNYYSFLYGPIVLAAKTGSEDLKGLYADDSRKGHVAHGHKIPLKDMPVLVSETDKILNHITPVVGKPLTFRLTNLYPKEKWGELELIPFFRLHDSRYVIYWHQATQEDVVALQKEIEQQEQDRIRLDAITIDEVTCGQQQPESDHFIHFENSTTGYTEGIHWREAKGWFNYQLQNKNKEANYIYLSYFDFSPNRQFDILINDKVIETVSLNGENKEKVLEAFYPIPENIRNEDVLTVNFVAKENSVTAKIAQVRLLSNQPEKEISSHFLNNPILPGFHPDPSICRVNDDYYMVTSSFTWYPGLPIYHSKDLVNWQLIGHAIDRPDMVKLNGLNDNDGIYAATIRYHEGIFYLITTAVNGGGNFYMTATDPKGPWSDPVWLKDAAGIDPSLFFDDDGKCYYTGNYWIRQKSWPSQCEIWMQELDLIQKKLVGERKTLTYGHANNAAFTEAPHLYKINGKYILMTAEGGTDNHHAVTVHQSDSLWGPYISDIRNPVLSHRHLGDNYPIQAIGHADLVQTQYGEWYAVALGKRMIDGHNPLARETFLCRVDFVNASPVFNPGHGIVLSKLQRPNLPWTPVARKPVRDDFDGDELAIDWYFIGTPHKTFYELKRSQLNLFLRPEAVDDQESSAMIVQKIRHHRFTAMTKLKFNTQKENEQAGLIIYRTVNGYYSFLKDKSGIVLMKKHLGQKEVIAQVPYDQSEVYLKVTGNGLDANFSFGETPEHMICVGST